MLPQVMNRRSNISRAEMFAKTHHVIVENIQIHRLKNSDNLFFESLLQSVEGVKGEDGFLPDVSSCAELRRYS
jgi:hypothetical protein